MSFNTSKSYISESRYGYNRTGTSSKGKNTPRRKSKRKKSKHAYEDRKRSRGSRIQVSFDGHCEQILRDPQYTNLVIRNKPDSTRSKESRKAEEKEKIELKYLRNRVEDETSRRKKAERERDTLINSLDDMTRKAKDLEITLKDFEKENIDLYEKLRRYNEELKSKELKTQELYKQIADLQMSKSTFEKQCEGYQKVVEDQKLLIGKQSLEITELKTTNKAFDISNKENMKNMNAVIEKMVSMSNERQKVKNELDHIILRRKNQQNLSCSSSFHQLHSNRKAYPYTQPKLLKSVNSQACVHTEKKQDGKSIDRSYSDINVMRMY
jgi:chromosome segregation ATPase